MPVRQGKKEIRDREVIVELLSRCPVGRLGTVGPDGSPMIKPLNFVFHEGGIYFHSAREGEKIDHLRRDCRVCFEVDLPVAFIKSDGSPCRAEYLYRSVIIRGTARIIDAEGERKTALMALMKKYQPGGGYGPFLPEKLGLTAVVRIDIGSMTGKEDLGTGAIRVAAEAAIEAALKPPPGISRTS